MYFSSKRGRRKFEQTQGHLDLGEYVYLRRTEREMSMFTLAEMADTSEATISRIENAKGDVHFHTVSNILYAMDLSLSDYEEWKRR